ncbi:hypothetical protein AWB67_00099 [Caballeronia terrestris]|uniref:Uncharacterized protein n=1 Tax=Caballeronia terrestris TaxID=1226301 RepID=A0A158EV43_9BURK|nr:hypothetical protein [Caballeronia terrestris]SAL11393.1 hypothetical protein AWB67_00099 [Caballeronia terrestris]
MGAVIVAAVFVIATIAGPQVVSDAARSQVERVVSQTATPATNTVASASD